MDELRGAFALWGTLLIMAIFCLNRFRAEPWTRTGWKITFIQFVVLGTLRLIGGWQPLCFYVGTIILGLVIGWQLVNAHVHHRTQKLSDDLKFCEPMKSVMPSEEAISDSANFAGLLVGSAIVIDAGVRNVDNMSLRLLGVVVCYYFYLLATRVLYMERKTDWSHVYLPQVVVSFLFSISSLIRTDVWQGAQKYGPLGACLVALCGVLWAIINRKRLRLSHVAMAAVPLALADVRLLGT